MSEIDDLGVFETIRHQARPVVVFGADQKLVFASLGFAKLCGMSIEELVGLSAAQCFPMADPEFSSILDSKNLASKPEHFIQKLTLKDGVPAWVEWQSCRLVPYNDAEPYVFLEGTDITRTQRYRDAVSLLYNLEREPNRLLEPDVMAILEFGTAELGMPYGILSKIVGNEYIVSSACSPGNTLKAGATFDLGATFCEQVVLARTAVGFNHVAHSEMAHHPAYKNFSLEAYIGAPVYSGDILQGTLNFSSPWPIVSTFGHYDFAFVALFASWIGLRLHAEESEKAASVEISTIRAAIESRAA